MEKLEKPSHSEYFKAVPGREVVLNSVEELNSFAFESESFEEVSAALEELEALQEFRNKISGAPFGSFHVIVEEVSNLNKLNISKEERAGRLNALIESLEPAAARFSPRAADLYLAILAEIKGETYESKFDITREKIQDMKESGDLQVLFSGNYSWKMKLNRIETRLTDYLLGVRAFDKRDGKEMDDDIRKWREEELKKAPTHPPQRRNESKPGVDSMERLKEGERAPAFWVIEPGFSGTKYFKEKSLSKWDSGRNVWVEDTYNYSDVEQVPLLDKEDPKRGLVNLKMTATVTAGQWTSCPIPYTHGFNKIETSGRSCAVQQDQNGDVVIFVEGEGEIEVKVSLAAKPEKRLVSEKPQRPTVPEMPSEFSKETKDKLAEIRKKGKNNIARARMLASYARSRIKYLAPKSQEEAARYNASYNTDPKGFAGSVDEIREGDCDVVNTYFAALCSRLGIPVRHVVGHSVKGRDLLGNSEINSGTGHGWSEVWDEIRNEWALVDATPPGDPNLEDERESGGSLPPGWVAGDDIEQEAVRQTDEQLEELRKKLSEHKEKLSYTKEERQLAEAAGIELKEARKIVKEINEAESARLSNGELVVDVMAHLFDLIAESRKRELPAYTGPVRRKEGGEQISDLIRHYIGTEAGESDPMSRERSVPEMQEEKLMNGMDVYVIGDKSGSVFSSASEEGGMLWKLQRRFEYLLFSSLYRFNRNLEKAHLPADKNLDVRTMAISFRGDSLEDIDLDKPLSPRFTAEDKVKMWHSLAEGGGGNGDVAAMQYLHQKISEEKEKMAQEGVEDNRLRIIVAYSDGGYVGAEAEMRAWAEEMSKLNVVVVGIGLTESAASVPVVMHNPPKSFGEVVSNLEELTAATAKHIVLQAIKLLPAKARRNAEQLIDEVLQKFGW